MRQASGTSSQSMSGLSWKILLASAGLLLGIPTYVGADKPEAAVSPEPSLESRDLARFFGKPLQDCGFTVHGIKPLNAQFLLVLGEIVKKETPEEYPGDLLFIVRKGESSPYLILGQAPGYHGAYMENDCSFEVTSGHVRLEFHTGAGVYSTPEFLFALDPPEVLAAYPMGTEIRGTAAKGSESLILVDDGVAQRVLRLVDSQDAILEVVHTVEEIPDNGRLEMRQGPEGPEIGNDEVVYRLINGSWTLDQRKSESEREVRASDHLSDLPKDIAAQAGINSPIARTEDGESVSLLSSMCGGVNGIVVDKTNATFFPLPQPDEDTYYERRPTLRVDYEVVNSIGPYALGTDGLLFGVAYDDGEGCRGVGGWGTFDFTSREYEIHYPPEMAGWSACAVLVEKDELWFGLIDHHESSDVAGGLLRVDRSSEETEHYSIPEVIQGLYRCGEAIVAVGSHSVFRLADGAITRTELLHNPGGSLLFRTGPIPLDRPWY